MPTDVLTNVEDFHASVVVLDICPVCRTYIGRVRKDTKDDTIVALGGGEGSIIVRWKWSYSDNRGCFVCLGLWSAYYSGADTDTDTASQSIQVLTNTNDIGDDAFMEQLVASVREASRPYHDSNDRRYQNRYSRFKSIPTVMLPGDLVYRLALVHALTTSSTTTTATTTASRGVSLSIIVQEYVTALKQFIKSTINECCNRIESSDDNDDATTTAASYYQTEYPSCICDEELGYLTFHTIVTPTFGAMNRPTDFLWQQQSMMNCQHPHRNKRTRKERMMKQNSYYITTDDDRESNNTNHKNTTTYTEQSQGGDPRINFERRFMAQQQRKHGAKTPTMIWSIQHAMDQLVDIQTYIASLITQSESNSHLGNNKFFEHVKSMSGPDNQIVTLRLFCETTVWRRPFYIRGIYTKIHRTISQTPFFVIDDEPSVPALQVSDEPTQDLSSTNDGMETVATVSSNFAAANIPTKRRRRLGTTSVEEVITPYILEATNGVATHNNYSNRTDSIDGGGVVYGMAKFHASGREDMNVRMLLPSSYDYADDNNANDGPTGRPFVYEIYDAIRLPRIHDLQNIVSSINHLRATTTDATVNDERRQRRSYGYNPLGVDISKHISLVPSSSFKRLQEETENKIKYYECYCWCEQSIYDIIKLHQRQTPESNPKGSNDAETVLNDLLCEHVTFPIEIQQSTPIRVLHRRTNMIRPRHIHSCRIQLLLPENDDNTNSNSATCLDTGKIDPTQVTTITYQPHHFIVHLSTSAGTYVKEFIHGDLGRTVPNLSTLFGAIIDNSTGSIDYTRSCRTDILELDCTGIQS